jgi:hypothetical protein
VKRLKEIQWEGRDVHKNAEKRKRRGFYIGKNA